jgi:Sec-independent protein translocase protein TatA
MEILGLGIPEWLVFGTLLILVVGPKDTVLFMRRAARLIRKLSQSQLWREMRETERELRDLPTQLIREAGIEELQQTMQEVQNKIDDRTSSQNSSAAVFSPLPRNQ